MARVKPDQLRVLPLDIPQDTVCIAYGDNSNFLPSSSKFRAIETTDDYRVTQLRSRDLRRVISQAEDRYTPQSAKAEAMFRQTSLLADLAMNNTRADLVQESRRTKTAAEKCFDGHTRIVMDIVKTFE